MFPTHEQVKRISVFVGKKDIEEWWMHLIQVRFFGCSESCCAAQKNIAGGKSVFPPPFSSRVLVV